MMKTIRRSAAFAAACALALSSAPAPAGEALSHVPADSAIVLGANGRALFDSPAFKRFYRNHPENKKFDNGVRLVEMVAGVNILEDLDEAVVFVLVPDEEQNGVLVRGSFEQEKLVALLQFNETYDTISAGGRTVHTWVDDKKGNQQFGLFYDDSTLLIATSRSALDASLAATANPSKSFGASAPARDGSVVAWASIANAPQEAREALGLKSAAASVSLDGDNVTASATVSLTDPALAEHWVTALRGAAALPQMQLASPGLAEIGRSLQVSRTADGSVTASLSMNLQRLKEIGEELKALDKGKHGRRHRK